MQDLRFEDIFVGLVALATTVWIVAILRRGLRHAWLPIGRGRVARAERPGAFHALFACYVAAALMMAFIGFDLLFGITPPA